MYFSYSGPSYGGAPGPRELMAAISVSTLPKMLSAAAGHLPVHIPIRYFSSSPRRLYVCLLFFYVPAHTHKLHGSSIERNSQRNINPSFMIMKMQIDRISLEEIINNIFKMVIEFF